MNVVLKDLLKRYAGHEVVKNISLDIADGEFFTLLGPSGCGKTTLLRMLAGFAEPDGGEIYFGQTPMSKVAPHKRETGMVFQSYALFPQMSVFENVAYGLRARGVSKSEISEKVAEALESVKLASLKDRYPSQLSGGQQQRVALARALVIRPRVLLMDEPLSNLDARLRLSMREEIRRIQKRRKITTIYVTHDQEEAMAVSDRIAIINAGQVEQVGSPEEIYFAPASRFAAKFMGSCNLLELESPEYDQASGTLKASLAGAAIELKPDRERAQAAKTLMLRPEWLSLLDEEPGEGSANAFKAKVAASTFLGASVSYQLELANGQELKLVQPDPGSQGMVNEGESVWLGFKPERAVLF